MKKFLIAGSIVDTDADKETFEDVTPVQVNAFLKTLEPNEPLELDITSYGGSVSAGIAICNLLKQASAVGHKTTAHVIGIAASMASAIACACDQLKMDSNAFMMLHLPWTMTMGNAIDLRKEAEVLDQYRDALISVYRTKFNTTDDVLRKILEDETWILADQAGMFNLKAEIIPTAEPLRIAASLKMPKFKHVPKALNLTTGENTDMEDNEQKTEQKLEEEVQQAVEAAEVDSEKPVEEQPAEQPVEQPVEETVPKAEVEKRVSGMQSAMAKQMDAMKKDYEARITEFQVQIKAKDEELTKAKADVTSLSERLEKANGELSHATSALAEKENALAVLNAGVNTPAETTDWKSLKGKAFFDWYKKTH